jgi:uncharacterized membrane protein YccF (DUF307 family)
MERGACRPSPEHAEAQSSVIYQRGPRLLVRFIWWLFIGWWASGIAVTVAWVTLITISGIPLGIWIINRLPSILTLRPWTRHWDLGQDEQGREEVSDRGRPQIAWPIRGLWFILVGRWASGIWMSIAWLVQLTIIGIPLSLLMFNRTPFIASLYRSCHSRGAPTRRRANAKQLSRNTDACST